MGFSSLTLLLFLTLISILAAPSSSATFNCTASSPATTNCQALIDYVPTNATTLNAIETLFNISNLRTLLGANNLPLSTRTDYPVPAASKLLVPFSCLCYDGSGVSNRLPVYTVKAGDSLDYIASLFSRVVTFQDIAQANGMPDDGLISVGQSLRIPLPCSCDRVVGEEVVHYGHVVEAGSSVQWIADEYGTTPETLLRINGITDASELQAGQVIDVPLKACASSVSKESFDSSLLVPNNTYVFTAYNCVKCQCSSANNWTLQCEPSNLNSTNFGTTCPSMQCQDSNLYIGNTTSSPTCNQATCAYTGYNNETILTSLVAQSTCSIAGSRSQSSHGRIIGISVGVSAAVLLVFCIMYISRKKMIFLKKGQRNELDIDAFIRNYGSIAPKRYSYPDVVKMTNSFEDQIGKGGYGTVYKGKLPDGLLVAVKVLSESKGDGEEFINEVASIGRTSHVNVVTLLGFCYQRNKRALIYEYMPNGSLDKFIHKQGSFEASCHLEWNTLSEIAVGVARGLEYLHRGCNTRILHFDIKPQNILLDIDFCPKIADFGLAKLCKTRESIVSMFGTRGTAGYIAPEVFSRSFGGVSHKSDVYSYGMLVLEMVGARRNLHIDVSRTSEMFPHHVYKDLELGNEESFFSTIPEEENETVRKMILISLCCIQTFPSERPSISKVVEMLEGPLHSLTVPPRPLLFTPTEPAINEQIVSSDAEESISYDQSQVSQTCETQFWI